MNSNARIDVLLKLLYYFIIIMREINLQFNFELDCYECDKYHIRNSPFANYYRKPMIDATCKSVSFLG